MQKEAQCPSNARYLFADELFADAAIKIWQQECISRCKGKKVVGEQVYTDYVRWVRRENEVAVFTLYAYADLTIPKKLDCIFQLDNPQNNLRVNYVLTQCIWEAWVPLHGLDHGHKHLCVFEFDQKVPGILNLLHRQEGKFSTVPLKQTKLGFCQSADFPAITEELERINKLKTQYGTKWWEHDEASLA